MLMNRDFIKDNMLSSHELKIYNSLKRRQEITAPELCERDGISVQNATTKLKKIYAKGYFSRIDIGDPSGGSLYKYSKNVISDNI